MKKFRQPTRYGSNRIKSAITTTLGAKGWTQVPSGGNVAIVAVEINKEHQTLNTYYDGFGGGWGWRWGGGLGETTTTVDRYEVGTLVVDLFDANTKQLLWRGSASSTLSDKPDKDTKNLDKGVEKMFDHFPPGAKKSDSKLKKKPLLTVTVQPAGTRRRSVTATVFLNRDRKGAAGRSENCPTARSSRCLARRRSSARPDRAP